jgi:hypothetical protein
MNVHLSVPVATHGYSASCYMVGIGK